MNRINSHTTTLGAAMTIEQLKERANYMRGLNLISLCCAGSGHSGGTLSMMDILAALYLKVARHDPKNPRWDMRDRILWSAGHKAPALYVSLAVSGYYPEKEVAKLRALGAPFQGHPHWRDLPGVEISSGSLGQGFSVAVGIALAAKLDKKDYHIFVISSDGEHQEGSMWEAAMAAANFKLNNLTIIIDRNRLQIDGPTEQVMRLEPLADKYRAFGWEVREIDGHTMEQIVATLEAAKANTGDKPSCIIANTVKGKGVSFMENVVGWHGKSPNKEELEKALVELKLTGVFDLPAFFAVAGDYQKTVEKRLDAKMPHFERDYWWNTGQTMKVTMDPTRMGMGRALDEYGGDERVVCIGADISDSITISDFYKKHPERKDRWFSVGVAEQGGTTVAAGLAKEGKIPVFGTYGVFSSARNLDQLRVSVCYGNFNVLIVGAHGGVSVGPDGATHQELEALFQLCGLPNMHVSVPCDAVEVKKATKVLLFDIVGPKYLRFAREATPIITTPETPFVFGKANVHRFRGEQEDFVKAFDICLAEQYRDEHEDLTLIACGPETAEACRAAWILRREFGLETRVLNMHTLKPLDRAAVIRAAHETGAILTCEEHQVGGLGNWIASTILSDPGLAGKKVLFDMLGVTDRFGESGKSWQLIKEFGLSAEHIVAKAKKLLQNR
ncbi:MAG: transketolase [candidate division Zixibacteria bacterium]|nr:transketolase [candidate division Zixibacteria bacterium]